MIINKIFCAVTLWIKNLLGAPLLGFKKVEDDPIYNRRRFMAMAFLFAVWWGFAVLLCRIFGWIDNTATGLLLGYIATLSGAGIFTYFQGAKKEDNKRDK